MPGFDESRYARSVAEDRGFELHEVEIGPEDFVDRMGDVIYHLDYPVAGPGSFAQFMVSELAARHRKVVLGGHSLGGSVVTAYATWDFGGGFNAGAYFKGTDAHHDLYTVKGKDWSKNRLVGFVSYSF